MELYEIRKALMSGKTIYDLPLRVTYYARVSTDTEEQKNSLENQDTYYKNKILSIPKWSLVKGYTDEGITGTSTKKSIEFSENKRGTNRWNSRYLYSGLLICAEDDKTYWRTKHRPSANEEFWICSEYKKYGNKVSCTNTELATLELNQIMEKVFNELIENKGKIKNRMLEVNNKLEERLFNENMKIREIENKCLRWIKKVSV